MSAGWRWGWALVGLGVCCGQEKTLRFSPVEEARFLDRFTGRWALADGSVSVTLCPRAASFCDEDTCAGKPCRSMERDGLAASITYESTDLACDCYGCECHDYRAGFAVTVAAEVEGCEGAVPASDALVASQPSGGARLEPVTTDRRPLSLDGLAFFGDQDALRVEVVPGDGGAASCDDALAALRSRAGAQGLELARVAGAEVCGR